MIDEWFWMLVELHLLENLTGFPSLFVVYRTSPSEFIVPFDQYMKSVKNSYSIGMRFKIRFEGEEAQAPEQRFTGAIVGTEEADPKRWPESKWRCLKVVSLNFILSHFCFL